MNQVTVTVPLDLTREMMRAVREDPLCQVEGEQWHTRLGWLICAWDVLLQARPPLGDTVPVPREALEWLMGERGDFTAPDTPAGQRQPAYWWRSEFQKRAGL